MGYAGNCEPNYIVPSVIALNSGQASIAVAGAKTTAQKKGVPDLDFYIGDEAYSVSKTYQVSNPIKHGQVENWSQMEQFWEHCIFKYLRCEPEDHYFLLVCSSRSLIFPLELYIIFCESSAILVVVICTFFFDF